MAFNKDKIAEGLVKYPKPDVTYTYGTAGFRMKSDLLPTVLYRMGLLAVLRSRSQSGKVIGVMITASHNPAADNGVKLVEPMGEMLAQSWEAYATQLANAKSADEIVNVLESIIQKEHIPTDSAGKVAIGRDTRPSGELLVAALKDGVAAVNGESFDYGLTTTPQLHYITRCLNTAGTAEAYGEPTREGYFKKLRDAYKRVVSGKAKPSPLYVDAANGIGAPAAKELAMALGEDVLTLNILNDNIDVADKLNFQCGADFVKVNQRAPIGFELKPGMRCCSLDGDADRIVYWYAGEDGRFKLLDGDKIATLAAQLIMTLVRTAKIEGVDVGLVQTAYANGSATNYVKDALKVPVVFTATGVKHLHHAAEEFDVGVYFEANGHGTVLFSPKTIQAFRAAVGKTEEERKAIEALQALTDLINQSVGDALSDMLMVEAILSYQGVSLAQWDAAYTDLPSRLEKVKVKNRLDFVAINADRELSRPEGLQGKINHIVSKFQNGRSFVRPSGTEDVVRIYAEAATQADADLLANIVCGLVFDHYGGTGTRPDAFRKVNADGEVTA
ncbi:Phosphoacetylglucosamine Mutase [Gaertneriomyces sp. JEL0708]|nr:Phosphoacetylglucosamine Mutase [Gaertneriomyces sp. JEL0708]